MRRTRILVVDDDPDIRELLTTYLQQSHFDVVPAADGRAMWQALADAPTDLVILDVMLPGDDGLALCRTLRASSTVPVVMLSARDTQLDRVLGLELGADDYVVKPFDPRELLARVNAVLRRATMQAGAGVATLAQHEYVSFAGWTLDLRARQMQSPEEVVITLPASDFHVLRCLLARANRPVSRDRLMSEAFGRERLPLDRAVDVCVSRLRQHLHRDGDTLIHTVRNEGYLLRVDGVTWR